MKRTAPLVSVMREAAGHPDTKRLYTEGEVRRLLAYRELVKRLAKKPPGLRPGLSVRRATDIVFAIVSGEVYVMLRGCGWTANQVHAWSIDVLGQQVLAGA